MDNVIMVCLTFILLMFGLFVMCTIIIIGVVFFKEQECFKKCIKKIREKNVIK